MFQLKSIQRWVRISEMFLSKRAACLTLQRAICLWRTNRKHPKYDTLDAYYEKLKKSYIYWSYWSVYLTTVCFVSVLQDSDVKPQLDQKVINVIIKERHSESLVQLPLLGPQGPTGSLWLPHVVLMSWVGGFVRPHTHYWTFLWKNLINTSTLTHTSLYFYTLNWFL